MTKRQNLIGSEVRKLRYAQDLTQDMLAARCARVGWDVSRGTLAKVEAQVRRVSDVEVLILAKALKVTAADLYPSHFRSKQSVSYPSR